MASKAAAIAKAGWKYHAAKWVFNASGFNKYGLYSQDTLDAWQPEIQAAVDRLPEDVYDQRLFRISRALQLSNQKIYAPKEEWTTFEDDLNNRYLDGILDEVIKEMKEEKAWAVKG